MDSTETKRKKSMAQKAVWERWRAERGRTLSRVEMGPMYGLLFELPRRYGITVDDYDRMLRQQNGLCAICGQPPKAHKRLGVDHVHDETKRVRGLLCDRCNLAIGHIERIGVRRLIEYLLRSRYASER